MNLFTSNFSNFILVTLCLLFKPGSFKTAKKGDDVSHNQAFAPCEWFRVIFPCRNIKASFIGQKYQIASSQNVTRHPDLWKETESTYSGRKTTKDPFIQRLHGFNRFKKKNGDSLHGKITLPPLDRDKNKTPFHNNKTKSTSPATKPVIGSSVGTPTPWPKTLDPRSWEITIHPCPWKSTKTPYPSETTRDPYAWKITRSPYPWEITRATRSPYPWGEETTTEQDFEYSSGLASNEVIVIDMSVVVIIILILSLVYGFKRYKKYKIWFVDNRLSPSGEIMHPPARRSTTSDRNQAAIEDSYDNISLSPGGITNSASENSAGSLSSDNPPDYSVVVLDNFAESNNFPEVQRANALEEPPPEYDEKAFNV